MIRVEIIKSKGIAEIIYNNKEYFPDQKGEKEIFILPIDDFDIHYFTLVYYTSKRNDEWDYTHKRKNNVGKILNYGYAHGSMKIEIELFGKKEGAIQLLFDSEKVKYGLFSLQYPTFKVQHDPKNIVKRYSIAYFPSDKTKNLTYISWIVRALLIWLIVETLCGIWVASIVSPGAGVLTWEQYKIQLLIGVPVIAIGITVMVIQDIALINKFLSTINLMEKRIDPK